MKIVVMSKIKQFKSLLCQKFGRKAHSKLYKASLDICLVDCGIKETLLFDLWSVSSCDMKDFLITAKEINLLTNLISVFTVGMDVFLYNKSFLKDNINHATNASIPECNPFIIDISKPFKQPKLLGNDCEEARETVALLEKCLNHMTSDNEDPLDIDVNNIEEGINPPCLFGLLLGYPAVYWYNRRFSEDNCLSSESLYLYQITGELCEIWSDKGNNAPAAKSLQRGEKTSEGNLFNNNLDNCHTILSFSVPTSIINDDNIQASIKRWFVEWKSSVPWSLLYENVWLNEKIMEPQAVCL